MKIDRQRNCSP